MNALLIHNDNLPTILTNGFNDKLKFSIPQSKILAEDFSFDKEAHRQLEVIFNNKRIDVIFIPYTLENNNFLALTGLRLALHIRLTPEWEHSRIPIVFIGHETPAQIAKLSSLGSILFTTGIFTNTKIDFEDFLKFGMKKKEAQKRAKES